MCEKPILKKKKKQTNKQTTSNIRIHTLSLNNKHTRTHIQTFDQHTHSLSLLLDMQEMKSLTNLLRNLSNKRDGHSLVVVSLDQAQ
jgi:hypothetical protein